MPEHGVLTNPDPTTPVQLYFDPPSRTAYELPEDPDHIRSFVCGTEKLCRRNSWIKQNYIITTYHLRFLK